MTSANARAITKAIKLAQERRLEAGTFTTYEDLGAAWQEIFQGLGTFKSASYVTPGFAEACLAIVEGSKGFEVGTGESIRPYIRHYRGPNENQAVKVFLGQLLYL